MKPDQYIAELSRIDGADRAKFDALAKRVSDDARGTARAAVGIWAGPDIALSAKAARLLAGLDDLAIVPLLEMQATVSSREQTWRMRQIVRTHLELREEIAAMLDLMLDDRNIVPPQEVEGPVEEDPPTQRVCDVAYVQMRRLLHLAETKDEYYPNIDSFLHLDFEERDKEILKARKSRTWTDWLGQMETEPELDREGEEED